MSGVADDPRCPECGGPIGQTATYCMHCSTDLTDKRPVTDVDGNRDWEPPGAAAAVLPDRAGTPQEAPSDARGSTATTGRRIMNALGIYTDNLDEEGGRLLAPDGFVDNTLTVVVGIVGGFIVGVVGSVVFGILTESLWSLVFGLVTWLGATAYLVRRRTVQAAVAKGGYAVAIVLLLVPVVALSPTVSLNGGLGERGGVFLTLLVFIGIPAGLAAAVGWLASRFVPPGAGETDD